MKTGYGNWKVSSGGVMIKKMKTGKKAGIIVIVVIMALLTLNGKWIIFNDRSIEGSVVDAETGKPLEGVIVFGLWELTQYFSHGSGGYARISMEISDNDGKFKIPFWITFKPWTFNSSMSSITPIIIIYKPGYRFYSSNIIMRAGFPADISKTEVEKKELKEQYSINPAKLRRISTDKERIQNYNDLETTMSFPSWHYSKKQTKIIYDALRKEISQLPKEEAHKFDVGD